MSKIETKYHTELKSWPYKEASQIIKRQGGYSNFKIPEKKTLTKKSKKKINKHDLKTKIEKLILKLDNSKDSLIKWENYYIENAELFSIIYKKLYYIM